MPVKSFTRGHEVTFNEETKKWEPEIPEDRLCACCGKPPVNIELEIPARLSHTGRAYTKICKIDSCIAPIIRALNKAGIKTEASCCGHGKNKGTIILADGRTLFIRRPKK